MAWPKKGTRKLVVDHEDFLWHYDVCCMWCSDEVITVGKAGARYYLFIDPYPHSFTLGPAQIVAAIRWARGEGWSAETGPTKPLAFDEVTQRFVWLPADQRHLRELRPIPDNL